MHRLGNPEQFLQRAGTVWRQTTNMTQPAHQPGVISGVIFNHKVEMPVITFAAALHAEVKG